MLESLRKKAPAPRKGMPSPRLDEAEFKRRFFEQFADPAFAPLGDDLDRVAAAAWDAYKNSRKSPHTRKAGGEFADPDYDLSVDWINARKAIQRAQSCHENESGPARFLLINTPARARCRSLGG